MFYFFILLILGACQPKEVHINDLSWLQGTWQIEAKPIFEEWTRVNVNLYRGKGYEIRKNDTIVTETIEIVQTGENLFYIPKVVGQNDGKEVMFKLISKNPEYLIFENKNHDFPQRIIYHRTGRKNMDAFIEGQREDGYSKVEFPYVKVKNK